MAPATPPPWFSQGEAAEQICLLDNDGNKHPRQVDSSDAKSVSRAWGHTVRTGHSGLKQEEVARALLPRVREKPPKFVAVFHSLHFSAGRCETSFLMRC